MVATRAWNALRHSARDLVCDILYGAGLTRPELCVGDQLTIVTLHRVLPDEALREYSLPQIAVSVDELAWLVGFFREHFTCDTLSAAHRHWIAGGRPERPLLALTFDDGQLDNYLHARPVLERAGVRATFFLPVDAVDTNEPLWHDRLAFALRRLLSSNRTAALRVLARLGARGAGEDDRAIAAGAVARSKSLSEMARLALVQEIEQQAGGGSRPAWDGIMSWAQIRALAAAGHEMGSHTMTHPLLPRMDDSQLEREVAGSKARLEAELGTCCDSFCYPNGDCDDRVISAVRRAGYRLGVSTAWGPNRLSADPLQLTRCDLQGRTSRNRAGLLSRQRLAFRLSPIFAALR